MKAAAFAVAWFFVFGLRAGRAAPAAEDINFTAIANGALVESVSSEYGESWQARWPTDENPQSGWTAEKGANGPFSIVGSLPQSSDIRALEFDTGAVDGPGRAAKNVDVLISSTSATAGFAPLASLVLKSDLDKQHFDLAKAGSGLWIKRVVNSNHGDPEYSEIMEFRALGKQLTQNATPKNLSVTCSNGSYGDMHLLQEGAQLSGC